MEVIIENQEITKRVVDRLSEENEALWRIVTSRNKLIEDLLVRLPLSEQSFKKGLEMREQSWANDWVVTKKGDNGAI